MGREKVLAGLISIALTFQFLHTAEGYKSQIMDTFVYQDDSTEPAVDTMEVYFQEYEKDADAYLQRDIFEGTPMTGKMMATCAKITYDSTGIIVPLELALSQAQWESGMGMRGKSAENNPYNVGEWDRGTMWTFSNTQEGVQAYYNLMANDYLVGKDLNELLTNFVNTDGHRYASRQTYEEKISTQCSYINRWIEKYSDV